MESNIKSLLENITDKYLVVKNNNFTNNELANYIRNKPKKLIKELLPSEDYVIKASAGQTKWADVPWIVVFNKNETDGVQEGVYVAYLFSEDMKRVYLALMHGVEKEFKREGRKYAMQKINAKTADIRANYRLEGFYSDNNVHLASKGRGAAYSKAIIYHKTYFASHFPSNNELIKDLMKILSFYDNLLMELNVLTEGIDFSKFVGKIEEGKKILRTHFIRERNQKLILKAKQIRKQEKGELRCEVCDISFEEVYGERGQNFIEGHHKKPISKMKDAEKTLISDIALICANCHRMIHTKIPWITLEQLKLAVEHQKLFKLQ